VDYIGLGNQIAQALKAADPDRGGKRPVEVDDLVAEFEATFARTLAPRFDSIDRTDRSFIALQAAMERLPDSDARDAFAKDFIAIQALWEFLTPHEALSSHAADYKWLAQVYEAVKPTKVSDALLWHRLGAKTLALVHGHISNVEVTDTGLEQVVVDPEAIEALRSLVEQGELDLDPNRDLFAQPVTIEEVLDTIDARIQRRLAKHPHTVYKSLAEQIERLRQQVIRNAEDNIDFLGKALEVARLAVRAERMEAEGTLDDAEHLLDPHIGALTQIVSAYKPEGTAVIVDDVVRDIDTIVKQVRYTGWNETQEGDRTVRLELRKVLKKFGLDLTGPLFDNAYSYVRENY
jgi:type I restriction enzyme R subunit